MNRLLPILACLLLLALSGLANSQEDKAYSSLIGSWEGPLVLGRDNMNLAFTFSVKEGNYSAVLISGGMGIYGMPADTVRIDGLNVIIRIPRLDLEFTGTLRLEETGEKIIRIDGDWFQYSEMVPVVLLPVDEPTF
ncbi:uncharacterized protein METZ01_LOCUS8323 [marine metagenome]|jgi:hypothetical protein|uniref:Uncharacterized protein n=1 Tax=marine metagenome TaxID=408172 RepID=A0A381NMA3_9ZZZZ|tara:strand:- start:967 stop:1374 length:408 start_codon:yes stop_codon:yes gene_type:complete